MKKHSTSKIINFSDSKLDDFFQNWLLEGLTPSLLEEWKLDLSYNSLMREDLADWIKTMRERGWGKAPHPERKKYE